MFPNNQYEKVKGFLTRSKTRNHKSGLTTTPAATASKPQIARRIRVIFLLCGVEKAPVMMVSFFGSGSYPWPPNEEGGLPI